MIGWAFFVIFFLLHRFASLFSGPLPFSLAQGADRALLPSARHKHCPNQTQTVNV